MSKFFAKEMPCEYADTRIYYSEEDAREDKLWLDGDNYMRGLNNDLVCFADDLDALGEDIDENLEDGESYSGKYLKDTFGLNKADGSSFSDEEAKKVMSIAIDYYNTENRSSLCDMLELIYDEPFIYGNLHGACQGDWIQYVCPESLKSKLNYIEAVFFGTGTEWLISEEPCESADDLDTVNTVSLYTELYLVDDVRNLIAKELGTTPEEVVLLKIARSYSVIHYDYEEMN